MPRHNSSGHGRPGRNLSNRARMERGADKRFRQDLAPEQRERRPGRTVGAVVCPGGKTGFSKSVAEERLERYSKQSNYRGRRPVRVYLCALCDSWHLTSWPEPPAGRA